jgi:hypothetical protein
MPPDPVAFEGALNGQGPNLGQGLREPPPKAPGIVTHPLGGSTTTSVNTHGLRPARMKRWRLLSLAMVWPKVAARNSLALS